MKYDEVISSVLSCSVSGFYKWKKQNRPIIKLLEKYFTKEELEEFLQTEKIDKLENINLFFEKREYLKKKYLQYFEKWSISTWDEQGSLPLWFGLLWYLKKSHNNHSNFQGAAISFCVSPLNLIKSTNFYESKAVSDRVVPFLHYLDSFDGMYSYISSIAKDNMIDLTKIDDEKLLKEAEVHVLRFKEYGEDLEKKEEELEEEYEKKSWRKKQDKSN